MLPKPQKVINGMEMSNLPHREIKVIVVKMLINFGKNQLTQ